APALLRRLEDEVHGALEVAGLRQVFGGAQQHGGVAVMAAGMHLAVVGGAGGEAVALLDRQRGPVGAQAAAAGGVAAGGGGGEAGGGATAGFGQAAMHLAAELGELGSDDVRRAALLEAELGMGVDVAADARELGLQLGEAGDDGHGIPRAAGMRAG